MAKHTASPQKIDGKSLSPQKELVELLKSRFPAIFAEGKVNPDKLKQALGEDLDTNNERYGLSWAGKAECFRHIQETTTATLKPIRNESVDFDKTSNIFIEGDNLEILKILQKTYQNKIKLIYIDPPYNTGNDSFIYPDRFKEEKDDYELRAGIKDEEGLLAKDGFWRKNSKDAGHFHSNWLSMMYPRLFLAKNLLRDDGVIFVSIDDNEVHNLRTIMDEVFGEENFAASIVWQKRYTRSNNTIDFTTVVEHILVYARAEAFSAKLLARTDEADARYSNPDNDSRGPWKGASFLNPASPQQRPNLSYPLKNPNTGKVTLPTKNAWRRSRDEFERLQKEKRLYWGPDGKRAIPSIKMFLSEARDLTPTNFWPHDYAGNTDDGTKEVENLMDGKLFNNPKPVLLIRRAIEHSCDTDDIILDFFAGSCTTAHAVMQLNAEDGGNRKFICVQLAEPCEKESEAFKAGFKTIAEIGKERIRRAAKKIKEENNGKLDFDGKKADLGFKVFRLEESNFKQWRENVKTGEELKEQMRMFVDNVKKGVGSEDMLFEIILKNSRFDLNVKAEKQSFDGVEYYRLATEGLPTEHTEVTEVIKKTESKSGEEKTSANEIICLDSKITKKFVDKVLAEKPEKFTCLDIAFKNNDQLKTNTALQMESAKIEFKVI